MISSTSSSWFISDDVLIYSKSEEEHKRHVHEVLKRFDSAKLIVNKKKCNFNQRKLTFLGYEVSAAGILPSSHQVDAVKNWPTPTNVQEVRQFLGLSQHYRRFIPNFSTIASYLTALTHGTGPKKRKIQWTPDCQKSFDTIKSLLCTAPVLRLPDMDLPFRIETDSSDFGVGSVLLQPEDLHNDTWHPVAYESKKLSKEEQTFPAQERELIGIVHALRTWRCYVDGCSAGYVVYSDHNPLVHFRKQTRPTTRLVRWIAELELYSPIIKYKPGKSNIVADALSRSNSDICEPPSLEPLYLYASWSKAAIGIHSDWPILYANDREKEVKDTDLKELLERQRHNFVVRHNITFRKVKVKNKDKSFKEKLVKFVPYSERADLVDKYHEGFGHAKIKDMYNMFSVRYWWPNMRSDIELWISRCPACQLCGRKNTKSQEEMHLLSVPKAFERWHLDFIGPLPLTIKGNQWLITAVDYTTNWPIAQAMVSATKESVAQFIYDEIVMKFGCPIEIVTDRGSNFTSGLVEEYLKRIGVNHKLTSAFHPRTNGKVERYNGIIKTMLKKYVMGETHRWDDFVNAALWATRIRVHSSTGYSPFYLTYGRDPKLPGDPLIPFISKEAIQDPRTVAHFTARELADLGQHRGAAEARLKIRSEKDKEKWDAAMEPMEYDIGDLVLLSHETKFGMEPNFTGPFIITEIFEEFGTCRLESMAGQKLDSLVHKDRLKHAKGDQPQQDWYNPTVTRQVVKDVTSTRSGRNTDRAHVIPPVPIIPVSANFSLPPPSVQTKNSDDALLEVQVPDSEMNVATPDPGTPSTTYFSDAPIDIQSDPGSVEYLYDEPAVSTPISVDKPDPPGPVVDHNSESSSYVVSAPMLPNFTEQSNQLADKNQELITRENQLYQQEQFWLQMKEELMQKDQDIHRREAEIQKQEQRLKAENKQIELEKKMQAEKPQETPISRFPREDVEMATGDNYVVQKPSQVGQEETVAETESQPVMHDTDMPRAALGNLQDVPMLKPVPGVVPRWPFTFRRTVDGRSLVDPNKQAEEEEIEDILGQVGQRYPKSKRKVFKPTIPSAKRGKLFSLNLLEVSQKFGKRVYQARIQPRLLRKRSAELSRDLPERP